MRQDDMDEREIQGRADRAALRDRFKQSSRSKLSLSKSVPDQSGSNPSTLLAGTFYDQLVREIQHAQSSLAADEQLLLTYTGPGADLFIVYEIGFHNPHLILLDGIDADGQTATVMLHVNAAVLVMRKVKRKDLGAPLQIGFRGESEL